MNTKSILLLMITAAILPLTIQAKPENGHRNEPGERPSQKNILKHMDVDGNGSLSKEEAKGPLTKHFDKVDSDGNGEITKGEIDAAHKEHEKRFKEKAEKIKGADTDKNGSISYSEAEKSGLEKLLKNFNRVDTNADGEITKEEMKAMRQSKNKQQYQREQESE